MSNPAVSLPPGFRFHPTDEELILHYLRNRAASLPCPASIIADVDIYKFDPWDLPSKAAFGDREWYFFSPRDRKYPNGIRPNRAAASGYWKATGTDKPVVASKGKEKIGVKKALVFYKGRPPKGSKTDWIMHEYRLADAHSKKNNYLPMKLRDSSMRLDDWVLCRIYKKSSHQSPVDAEREDSGVEYAFMVTPPRNTQHHCTSKLPKSCSLSELLEADFTALSGLLDRPSDVVPGFSSENSPPGFGFPVLHQAFNSSCNNGSENSRAARHLLLAESPALVTENNGVKRPWTMSGCFGDGSEEALHVANRPAVANKFNSVNQPFFNHQLIWNAHFGLQ